MRKTTSSTRDRGLRQLRRATAIVLATGGALTAAFAGLAARALPGRHTTTTPPTTSAPTRAKETTDAKAKAPSLVPVQSAAQPAAPAAPPVQAQSPPVVVSGGT